MSGNPKAEGRNPKEARATGCRRWRTAGLRALDFGLWTLGFGLLVASLLAGCARFHPQPLSAARTADQLDSRTLDNPVLGSFLEKSLRRGLPAWPLPAWDFTNLTLAAFYYHPSLEVARADWGVAAAGKQTAAERPNPTVAASGIYEPAAGAFSPWIPGLIFDLPLETAGKRGYRMAQAAHLSEAARLNLASVAWQVRSGVRRGLVDLNAALQTETLLREQQSLQSENRRLLEGQYQAGAVSAFEVTQGGMAADSARLALRDAERQTAEARVQLADAIGVPVRALEGVKLSFDELGRLPGGASLTDARRQALLNRSDILSALAEYAAAQSALQLEIAKQYPDIHLNPGYFWNAGSTGEHDWQIGATVELPLLNRHQGPIAEAEARRNATAARFNALQAKVLSDIDRAVAAYHAALQKRADAEELLAGLQKQEQRSRAMFNAGEISKGDLTALRLQLSASALARLDALLTSQQALVQLEDALQGPLGLPASLWQVSPQAPESRQANHRP